jgi:IPT/TIG domain-containing protein
MSMSEPDDSSVTPGDGPGAEYVGWPGVVALAVYLLVLTFFIIWRLSVSWPICESGACKVSPPSASAAAAPPAIKPEVAAGGSTTPAAAFRLDRVDLASGPLAGGNDVTLSGAGFKAEAKVLFGDAPAQKVTVASPTKITASTPPHAKQEKVDVKVTNPDGASVTLTGGYTYGTASDQPQVKVTSIQPASGDIAGGDQVRIQGDGFLESPTVKLGDSPATEVKRESATSITAKTPAHAEGTVDVTVTNPDNSSGKLTGGYTYVSCLTEQCRSRLLILVLLAGALGGCFHALRSLWMFVGNRSLKQSWALMYIVVPLNGAVLAFIFFIVISAGSGFFSQPQGSNSCYWIIGIAALVGLFSQQAAEKLKMIGEAFFTTVPPKADSLSKAGLSITAIKAQEELAGKPVQIIGTGFTSKTTVTFGAAALVEPQLKSSTLIEGIVPQGTGTVDVTVTDPGSSAPFVKQGAFTYKTT